MKILLISLARRGGMVQYHVSLANALAKHLPVTIITAQVIPASLFDPTIQRYSLNTGQNASGTFFNLFSPAWKKDLKKALSQSNPNLVHIVAPHEWNPFVQRLIHKMGFPLAYSIHDPIAHPGTPLYFRIMETLSRNQPDAWFGLSKKSISQLIQQGYTKNQLYYAPLGTHAFPSNEQQAAKPRISEENAFLFFGRIEPYKGLDYLLKAAPKVFEKLPNWKLIIAGAGNLQPYRQLIENPQIEVINRFLSDEEVNNCFFRAKIIVMPYIEASQSAVITSAYTFGKAMIATDVGSISETLKSGENGELIPARDFNALAKTMISLAQNEQLIQKYDHNNRLASMTYLNWDHVAKLHVEAYLDMLSKFEKGKK